MSHPRLFVAALVTACLPLGACAGKKPSEAQCQEYTDHIIELMKQGDENGRKIDKLPLKRRDRLLELCTIEGTEPEVLCALEHDSFEAIAENCK